MAQGSGDVLAVLLGLAQILRRSRADGIDRLQRRRASTGRLCTRAQHESRGQEPGHHDQGEEGTAKAGTRAGRRAGLRLRRPKRPFPDH